jgi:TPR repeat protein
MLLKSAALALAASIAALGASASGHTPEVEALLDAARNGDRGALIRLATMTERGEAGAPSLEEIIAVERILAEAGDPVMAWRLARRYETGDGVAPSTDEMIRWLKATARADDRSYPKVREAAFRLCSVYGRGEGVSADQQAAEYWCRRAADGGDAAAAVILAGMRAGG